MQSPQKQTLSQRFQEYQASKTVLFWSCAGSVIVAVIVGFSWGGWVTGGTAQSMAEDSMAQGRQELAAIVCVDRFMAAPDAGVQLTALQDITSSYERSKFVQDGAWATMPGSGSAVDRKAAGLCAEALAKHEMPTKAAQVTDADVPAAQ